MKKILALILALVFLFSGCGAGNKSLGVSEEKITDTDIIKMKTTEVSSEQIAIEITNESKSEIGYGEAYSVEFKKDGEWHILKPKSEASFIEIGYILEKESTCTWGDKISRIYGKLPEGEYRLLKDFTIYENGGTVAENVTLAVQFRIG
ncbi:MAG: hypothetical protein E7479_08735 [Ruminococcaceae bacterium]|nr:hypothetical protein [Oscillospiraceae bacterium]